MVSENAQNVHLAMAWTGKPRNETWICKFAHYNFGLSTGQTRKAIKELLEESMLVIEVRYRNKNSKEYLYHYMENGPFSISWLEREIQNGLIITTRYDGVLKHRFHSMVLSEKSRWIRDYIFRINRALNAINLVVALKGPRKKYRTERKTLLKYYYLGFKLLRKDRDYHRLFQYVRNDIVQNGFLKPEVLEDKSRELWSKMKNANPKVGIRVPGEECSCGHTIDDHEISSTTSKCMIDPFLCHEFSKRTVRGEIVKDWHARPTS
jgi:hypothetical protein